jgi:hypothetical protein
MTAFTKNSLRCALLSFLGLAMAGCAGHDLAGPAAHAQRVRPLLGTFGTYDAEPRRPDQRVDIDRLVAELVKLKANTYNFLIHRQPTDWEDLKFFLPKARANHIRVWVTLVPPSEPPASEPFKLDFQAWAAALAQLSLQEPNLVAWSIDDFSYDAKIFTPDYLAKMAGDARKINPRLAFIPCLYYWQMTNPALVAKYKPVIDGILFPYRHEMGKRNLSQWDTLAAEIGVFRKNFGPDFPIFVDIYATKHSQLNDSSPDYVRQVMTLSRRNADGVLIYCHQYEDKSPEKYHVIQSLFAEWAAGQK